MIMEIYTSVRLVCLIESVERREKGRKKRGGSASVWKGEEKRGSSSKREERSPRKSVKESR